MNQNEIDYLLTKFRLQTYQLDTYMLFIEKSLTLIKESGLLGMIVPNTWLLNLTSTRFRSHIFEQTQIENIVHHRRQVFEKATVDTEIVVFQKGSPAKNHAINVTVVEKNDNSNSYTIPQMRWRSGDGRPVNIFESPEVNELANKLRKLDILDSLSLITQGAKPFQIGKGKPPQTRKIVDLKPYVSDTKSDASFRPLLRGNLIHRYQNYWNNDY